MNYLKKNNGFTLVELMAVTAIIGVATAIAIPNFTSMLPTIRVNSSMRALSNAMMLARSNAISKNTNFYVKLDTTNHSYTIYQEATGDTTWSVADTIILSGKLDKGTEFGKADGSIRRTSYDNNIDADGMHTTVSNDYVPFKPRGNSDLGSSMYIIPAGDKGTTRKDRMRAISIAGITGRVKAWRYDAGSESSANPKVGPWKAF